MNRTLFGSIAAMMSTATGLLGPGPAEAATFDDDVAFLKRHTPVIILSEAKGPARLVLAPAWQGRVMTSSAEGESGRSFGWVNRDLIASGKLEPHVNVFGGEDRMWLGPEGGQFSIFFAPGKKFEFSDWQTPAVLDTLPFQVDNQSATKAAFSAAFTLTNYSGTRFDVAVHREVRLLGAGAAWKRLQVPSAREVRLVAYESENKITNRGREAWKKETGLLSIWMLGMFNSSPTATIVVPIKAGPESELGVKVTADYFGTIPADRLAVKENAVFLKADGKFRSKIGISPKRSKAILGSYDLDQKVLTIVQFTQPAGATDYVNSLWKLQERPYGGDAANAYNDGPASPGAAQLGAFYELESSSPAAALKGGNSLSHVHRTFHLVGPEAALDKVSRATLGVSLEEITSSLAGSR